MQQQFFQPLADFQPAQSVPMPAGMVSNVAALAPSLAFTPDGEREREGFPGWAVSVGLALWPFPYFIFVSFPFPFSVFQNRFQKTPKYFTKIDKIGFDKNRSNAHLGIVL